MKLKTDLLILFKNMLSCLETYLEAWQTYKRELFAKTFNSDDKNVLLSKLIRNIKFLIDPLMIKELWPAILVKGPAHLIEDAINNKYLTKHFQGIGLKKKSFH